MTDFFTSDLHLGDDNVAVGLRGFATTAEHDSMILDNLDSVLTPGDRLFCLGDVTAGADIHAEKVHMRALRDVIKDNGARLLLIPGNHDLVHPLNGTASRATYNVYAALADWMGLSSQLRIADTDVMVSHFPYNGELHGVDNHVQHRLRDLGAPIIHGHTHSQEQISRSYAGTLQINVAVDAWQYLPVTKLHIHTLIEEHS